MSRLPCKCSENGKVNTDVSPHTPPAVWSLQETALFYYYYIPTQSPPLCPSVCFLSSYCQPKRKINNKKKNPHPFSNVENVVQMFLIVIIKAKSGYVQAGSMWVIGAAGRLWVQGEFIHLALVRADSVWFTPGIKKKKKDQQMQPTLDITGVK